MWSLAKPKRLGYSSLTTVRVGEVRFRVYPQDHLPRHVHGLIGGGEVIVDLRADGSVALANRKDAVYRVSRAEVRKVLVEAELAFDCLVRAWEDMHNG